MRTVWKLLIGLAALALLFLAGPRVEIDGSYAEPTLPEDLDAHVARSEAAFDDVVPGTEKRILWADPGAKAPTLWSIVYLHGFSGSRGMATPFVDSLARALGANAYEARLTGHGRTGEALAEATVADWIADGTEALAIGRRLGERIVLIGLSTGGTLALWAVAQPDLRDRIDALVLISPNVAPRDGRSRIFLWPWGRQIAETVVGKERSWEPSTELHGRFSTERYPTRALLPMMALVSLMENQDYRPVDIPVLVLFSERDTVVDPEATRRLFDRYGGDATWVEVGDVGDPNDHVIVGDALSSEATVPMVRRTLSFLTGLDP